jgi:hypothetical protein
MRWPGADRSVVARKALQWGWSEGTGSDNHRFETTGDRMTSSAVKDKPFKIDKRQVYKAYKAVKSNQGAAGVDGQEGVKKLTKCTHTVTVTNTMTL